MVLKHLVHARARQSINVPSINPCSNYLIQISIQTAVGLVAARPGTTRRSKSVAWARLLERPINQSMHQLFNANIHPCCCLPRGHTTRHDQAFEIGCLGQATCSVWSSARLIKVQGNPGQASFLFHRVATKQACMKSSHNPRLGKRCSGRKPN